MKKNLIKISICFLLFLLVGTGILLLIKPSASGNTSRGEMLLLLNEIENRGIKENKYSDIEEPLRKLQREVEKLGKNEASSFFSQEIIFMLLLSAGYMLTVFLYVYYRILRPFYILQGFAQEVAGGNLEASLNYERENYFGEFTWAFDHMKREILYARQREQKAIEENKTIIASLSHDIKTPIASIRACSEALEANLADTYEKRQRYVGILMKKCDEVTALVNDLVLHSLSELEKLQIKCEPTDIREVVQRTVEELEFSKLKLCKPIPAAVVLGDSGRISQVIENLINNARKYAPESEIHVFAECFQREYRIHVKDFGEGIPPQDMPFIRNKFYRGKNTKDMPGSGLGLYIVDYILGEMKGSLELNNSTQGLDAVVVLPVYNMVQGDKTS